VLNKVLAVVVITKKDAVDGVVIEGFGIASIAVVEGVVVDTEQPTNVTAAAAVNAEAVAVCVSEIG
jgi:molybdopterin-guanine dinucleotide biosynthesis protein